MNRQEFPTERQHNCSRCGEVTTNPTRKKMRWQSRAWLTIFRYPFNWQCSLDLHHRLVGKPCPIPGYEPRFIHISESEPEHVDDASSSDIRIENLRTKMLNNTSWICLLTHSGSWKLEELHLFRCQYFLACLSEGRPSDIVPRQNVPKHIAHSGDCFQNLLDIFSLRTRVILSTLLVCSFTLFEHGMICPKAIPPSYYRVRCLITGRDTLI